MFCGCGIVFMWRKRSPRRTLSKEEEQEDAYSMKSTTTGDKATAVRFFKPAECINQIPFRRSRAPSPEAVIRGDFASSFKEK